MPTFGPILPVPDVLKGIHPSISPELLKTLAEMGHGDEIVLADAHFPARSVNDRVIRADGVDIVTLLDGILALCPLDTYDVPVVMMAPVPGDELDESVESDYRAAIDRHEPDAGDPIRIDRFAFYERARTAFAVVATGERRSYGNIMLKKGLVSP